jgi:hypothetical protein
MISAGIALARAASHPILNGVRDFGIAKGTELVSQKAALPFHARAWAGNAACPGLKAFITANFLARDRITACGATRRCATAQSESRRRQKR